MVKRPLTKIQNFSFARIPAFDVRASFIQGFVFVATMFALLGASPWAAERAMAEELPWLEDGRAQNRVAQSQNPLPPDDYEPRGRRDAPEDYRDQGPDYEDRYERRRDYGNAPPPYAEPRRPRDYGEPLRPHDERGYSNNEIVEVGHRFFGSVSSGLAKVIEYAFSREGRPNGYILGEEAGGAFVAGLTYGEGTLYTKDAGQHRVYWQGPSIGYDFGAEGSKTMILVYNLYSPYDIYKTYPGISGSAYLVGGVGITFQKRQHVTLAPIRSGVGARLGANVGYLKYTRAPTWNPF